MSPKKNKKHMTHPLTVASVRTPKNKKVTKLDSKHCSNLTDEGKRRKKWKEEGVGDGGEEQKQDGNSKSGGGKDTMAMKSVWAKNDDRLAVIIWNK